MSAENCRDIFLPKWLRAVCIGLAGAALLIGCFSAPFIQYDDSAHIDNPAYRDASLLGYFVPKTGTTYIPLALASYKVDRLLHEGWTARLWGSWAPGARLDTMLIHVGAALFLWRWLALLRFPETSAFFVALLFVCHPVACEVVCWVSERKSALAGLFGFAALWTQAHWDRHSGLAATSEADEKARSIHCILWRWPVVWLLFVLALLGKPSALGLLPVMLLVECAAAFPALSARLFSGGAERTDAAPVPPNRVHSAVGCAVLCGIAVACLRVNLFTHSGDIVSPPGGSMFTALLTDLEIFARYIFNLLCPIRLSAWYPIDPILSLGDSRVWIYGAAIFAGLAGTVLVARNRWRCAFGWFLFFTALAPNANVIAIAFWMQDRYVYLAAAGVWIALSEFGAGVSGRVLRDELRRWVPVIVCAGFAVFCMVAGISRGYVWCSMEALSSDAKAKQPGSFYAHYGLGMALAERARAAAPSDAGRLSAESRALLVAALKCPDSQIFNIRQKVALDLGLSAPGALDAAEPWFEIGATKPDHAPDFTEAHAVSLAYLCVIDVIKGRDSAGAVEKARESLRLLRTDEGRFALGNALKAQAEKNPVQRAVLLGEARKVLGEIGLDSPLRGEASGLLRAIGE